MKRRRPLNWEIIQSNIAEAHEELAKMLQLISTGQLSEEVLQIRLRHAYHHMNFAWNIRRVSTSAYMALTDEQFEQWGQYPSDIDEL